ncbi:hypothetical protein FJZ53_02435 [Candidatus Woesearchaeota archaeon]|nr:hypothetical protein [Candidatus Woesearchaeota archaeon]
MEKNETLCKMIMGMKGKMLTDKVFEDPKLLCPAVSTLAAYSFLSKIYGNSNIYQKLKAGGW